MSASPVTICVFCGSRPGTDPAHLEAATLFGRELGARAWRLVYGGGKVGLMGALADAALAAGAEVVGIIPESLMQREVGHRQLSELHVVPTMHVRKQMMADRADAFVALPGGLGTLEELFEVWTWRQLGYHQRPLGLLNSGGYFDPLLAFIERSVQEDFVSRQQQALLLVDAGVGALLNRIAAALPAGHRAADLGRT